jgi:hypothetical protein
MPPKNPTQDGYPIVRVTRTKSRVMPKCRKL